MSKLIIFPKVNPDYYNSEAMVRALVDHSDKEDVFIEQICTLNITDPVIVSVSNFMNSLNNIVHEIATAHDIRELIVFVPTEFLLRGNQAIFVQNLLSSFWDLIATTYKVPISPIITLFSDALSFHFLPNTNWLGTLYVLSGILDEETLKRWLKTMDIDTDNVKLIYPFIDMALLPDDNVIDNGMNRYDHVTMLGFGNATQALLRNLLLLMDVSTDEVVHLLHDSYDSVGASNATTSLARIKVLKPSMFESMLDTLKLDGLHISFSSNWLLTLYAICLGKPVIMDSNLENTYLAKYVSSDMNKLLFDNDSFHEMYKEVLENPHKFVIPSQPVRAFLRSLKNDFLSKILD
jgi:hypothetical protein